MSDADPRRNLTLNGMFDARCVTCLKPVYCLWVDREAPPPGCVEGQDAMPWLCGHVQNAIVMRVIREDHLGKQPNESDRQIEAMLGPERTAAMLAKARATSGHARAGEEPAGEVGRQQDGGG